MPEYVIRFCFTSKVEAPDCMRAADKVACWVVNLEGFDHMKPTPQQRGDVPFEILDWGYVDSVEKFLFHGENEIQCPFCRQRIILKPVDVMETM